MCFSYSTFLLIPLNSHESHLDIHESKEGLGDVTEQLFCFFEQPLCHCIDPSQQKFAGRLEIQKLKRNKNLS
jgi:hypothetical protein